MKQKPLFEDFEIKEETAPPKPVERTSEVQSQLWTGLESLPGQRDFTEEQDVCEDKPRHSHHEIDH